MLLERYNKIFRYLLHSIKQGNSVNAMKTAFDVMLWPDIVLHLPEHLKIEITTKCNLECQFCGRTYNSKNSRPVSSQLGEHMSLDIFQSIINEIPVLLSIDIQGTGEPLYHPDFPSILEICTQRGVTVEFFTNATMLDEANISLILDSSVRQLTFSMDAASPEMFENIRFGAHYNQVVENISHFMKIRASSSNSFYPVRVMMVLANTNLDQIRSMVLLCRKWGIEELVVSRINIPGPALSHLEPEEEAMWHSVSQAELLAAKENLRFTVEIAPQKSLSANNNSKQGIKCLWPWYSANILVDGSVTPCPFISYSPEMNMGNIHDSGFISVWNGRPYQALRAAHRTDKLNDLPCFTCRNYTI
jgi:radical SAM protein with 4Fe4S-binding SPASM domain